MKITIVLDDKILTSVELPITEAQAMRIFNIESIKETFIDSKGLLEFHNKKGVMLYTDHRPKDLTIKDIQANLKEQNK